MAPRLYSAPAASARCSGRLLVLCKSHRSYELLPPVRHGWIEAACLHRANKTVISHSKQWVIRPNTLLTAPVR